TRAQAVYDFVDRNFVQKQFFARGEEAELMSYATSIPRMSDRIPLIGSTLANLIAVSPNAKYKADLETIVSAYIDRLKPVGNDGVVWLDVGEPCLDGDSCDTSHGGHYVRFMTEAFREGRGITLSQLHGIAKLLSTVLWNGSTTDP